MHYYTHVDRRKPKEKYKAKKTSARMPSDVSKWSDKQVAGWVDAIPGCDGCGELFQDNEIDGTALLLLKEDHMFNMLELRLGKTKRPWPSLTSSQDLHSRLPTL